MLTRFDMMPSSPMWQTCSNTVGPSSRVTWYPCGRWCVRPRERRKPLQIAVDDVPGTTEATTRHRKGTAMSALRPEADIWAGLQHVCFVPRAEKCTDHRAVGKYGKCARACRGWRARLSIISGIGPQGITVLTHLAIRTSDKPSKSRCLKRKAAGPYHQMLISHRFASR